MITLLGCSLLLAAAQLEPTAEELLRALREKRPTNPIIASATLSSTDDATRSARLYPEGYAFVEQRGMLAHDGDWWTFELESVDIDLSSVRLLANQQLEVMTLTTVSAQQPIQFILSGEMTVFEKENYLLIHRAVPDRSYASKTKTTKKTDTTTIPKESKATNPGPPSIDRVIESMRHARPPADALSPAKAFPPTVASNDKTLSHANVMPEGALVVRRPGRIVRRQNGWFFVFESDHPDYPEPPILLHPNQTVELMIKTSEQGVNGLVFLVTGDVTLFQDQNYLLARMAIRRIDSGNLTK